MTKAVKHSFKGHSGYIISPQDTGQDLVALGHTALLEPWTDGYVHEHTVSEEYYFLLQGTLNFIVADMALTLRPREILMIKPKVPHAITGGAGLIEHFGIRAPALSDKRILGEIPSVQPIAESGRRELRGEWGCRIPLDLPKHQNCWLIGAGSALFESNHLILAYLNFPTSEAANAGLGARHCLHYH